MKIDWEIQNRKGRLLMQDFACVPDHMIDEVLDHVHFSGEVHCCDRMQYIAFSDHFAPLNSGQMPPLYRMSFGPGGMEFVKDVG